MSGYPTCPGCPDCAHRVEGATHEAWWLAMCQHFAQCPDDPDAFWNVPRDRFESEKREAQLDPVEYLRERGYSDTERER